MPAPTHEIFLDDVIKKTIIYASDSKRDVYPVDFIKVFADQLTALEEKTEDVSIRSAIGIPFHFDLSTIGRAVDELNGLPISPENNGLSLLARANQKKLLNDKLAAESAAILKALDELNNQGVEVSPSHLWAALWASPTVSSLLSDLNLKSPFSETNQQKDLTPFVDFCDPVDMSLSIVDRAEAVSDVIETLQKRSARHPVFVGPSGIGKKSILVSLAQQLKTSSGLPKNLQNVELFTLRNDDFLAEAITRQDAIAILGRITSSLSANPDTGRRQAILAITDIHVLLENTAIAEALKPLLSSGKLRVIATATPEKMKALQVNSPSLANLLESITVDEMSPTDTLSVLRNVKSSIESHNDVTISDEAIATTIRLSLRYLPVIPEPKRSILVLEGAAARAGYNAASGKTKEGRLLESALRSANTELASIPDTHDNLDAREAVVSKIRDLEEKLAGPQQPPSSTADSALIAEIISEMSGVPCNKICADEDQRIRSMAEDMRKKLIGQDELIECMTMIIKSSRAGMSDPNKPLGSMLISGTSGTGKTEFALLVAELVFGSRDAVVILDGSDFMHSHSVARLVGSPPGYVGSEQGGDLTEAVKKNPYCLVLFDEIEKAHPDVVNIFLQVLSAGRLTDAQGVTVDFRNTVIIATSNVGSAQQIKLFEDGASQADIAKSGIDSVKGHFRPEILGRFTSIQSTNMLRPEVLSIIGSVMLGKVSDRFSDRTGSRVEFGADVIAALVKECESPLFGARPIINKIERDIQPLLSELIMSNTMVKNGPAIMVSVAPNGEFVINQPALNADPSVDHHICVPGRINKTKQPSPKSLNLEHKKETVTP